MRLLGFLVAVLVVAADQGSKDALIELMKEYPGGLAVTPFMDLVMVWNYGVSFGLFNNGDSSQRWILIAISGAITLFLIGWLWRARTRWIALALGLVIGGAIGNIADRIRFGAVADFFYFHIGNHYWPAFNFADAAIVCGVGLLVAESLFAKRESR